MRPGLFNGPMRPRSITTSRRTDRTSSGRVAHEIRRRVGQEIRQLREDSGISQRRLAAGADINQGFLCRIERGDAEASVSVLAALGEALNTDLSIRFFPNAGPRVRDRNQSRMVEALVAAANPVWRPLIEVPVARPGRGWVDAVLVHRSGAHVVACEAESEIRRLEHQVRRHQAKADSLPSAEFWRLAIDGTGVPAISRLLLLRSTRASKAVAAEFAETLAIAYPARVADLYAALVNGTPWPGSGILWATVTPEGTRLLEQPLRGIALGR